LAGILILERLTNRYNRLEASENEQANYLKSLDIPSVTVGKILASSGAMVNTKSRGLDWALVEYSDSPTNSPSTCGYVNRLPSEQHLIGKKKTLRHYGFPSSHCAGDRISSIFDKMEKDEWYLKAGRTTSVTAGICNGTLVDVVLANQIYYDEEENEERMEEKIVKEYVVISYVTGSRQLKSQDEFCMPGDEGSFVVNSCGQISGLLHGSFVSHCGPEDDYSNAGLVSCMTDINPSIEKRAAWRNSNESGRFEPATRTSG